MRSSTLIVTAADSRYFDFLSGCIESINRFRRQQAVSLAVFDLGFSERERRWLQSRVDTLCVPGWHFEFAQREERPSYFRGLLARPFLKEYFSGFEVYLWLDADAWVQDWGAIELFCEGALRRRGLAVVPEIDRGSLRQYGGLPEFWKVAAGWYSAVFSDEVAARLCSFPMLNAGVFALHRDAPHWREWADAIRQALQRRCSLMTDQLALNYITYARGLFSQTEMLPAWCNWTCHNGFPKWDEQRGCLVEPYLPHTRIGIVHLTTRDKNPFRRILTTSDQEVEIRLMYPAGPISSVGKEVAPEQPENILTACEEAMRREPHRIEHRLRLATILAQLGRSDEAAETLTDAQSVDPDCAELFRNLGSILLKNPTRLHDAAAALRRAIELDPHYAQAYNELGYVLKLLGRLKESVEAFQGALRCDAKQPAVLNNLSVSLRNLGRLTEAAQAAQKAIELKPEMPEAHTNLGVVLTDVGRTEEADAAFQKALELRPNYASAHSRRLFNMQYLPGITAASLHEAHLIYDRRHAAFCQQRLAQDGSLLQPDKPLTIGLVSDGFGLHPVGYFIVRLLENVDRSRFRIVCYSDRTKIDDMTARIRAAASSWKDVYSHDNESLAQQIGRDKVDILFDLSGHVGGQRMQLFARKPAPVQITWIGYVGTTGLSSMDYLLADGHHVPPEAELHYCEQVLRLPDGYVCYDPPDYSPEVNDLPAATSGRITFGNLGQPAKLNKHVVRVWAMILKRIPDARFLLKYGGLDDAGVAWQIRQMFAEAGVEPNRVEMLGKTSHAEHLAAYHRVDVALDTFPYSGGLTTCEALWMGVPVVTFPGDTFAGRHSLSHLRNVGLEEAIATGEAELVARAVELATDVPRLSRIRAQLRAQVRQSPLCDGPRFAVNWGNLMRTVWLTRCARSETVHIV